MTARNARGWTIRPACSDDIDGVCELIDAYSIAVLGTPRDARRDVELTWTQPRFDMHTDTRVAVLPDGRIIGYGEVEDTLPNHARIGSWLRAHPDYRDQGLEVELLSWIETRAKTAIPLAPADTRVALSQGVPMEDELAQVLFRARGYRAIRHFLRMAIELDKEIPEPVWPAGVTVRTFDPETDLEETVRAYRDAFQDHWGHVPVSFEEDLKQWKHWFESDPEFDPTLTFLAVADHEIAGLSSCDFKCSEDPEMGYVGVLGVCRAWRRRGVALALLHHTFQEFKDRGRKRVGLGVDATSLTGANRVYEAAGMRPTRRTVVYETVLREGANLSVESLEGQETLP